MSAKKASAYKTTITFPTYTHQPARELPALFQDGGRNYYPDTQDDILGGEKIDQEYEAIILENDFLKITILPELGAKLFAVYDKLAQEDSIYVPDVIKPGLIHTPGAWVPGGMEFNYPYGHLIKTMRYVPVAIISSGPDTAVCERQYTCAHTGLAMNIRISLKADEARFAIDYALSNPTPVKQKWYLWTNVGIETGDDWRFFAPAKYASTGLTYHGYPVNNRGHDISWCKNRDFSADAFILGLREDYFGYFDYRKNVGIAHIAPWKDLPGKKYFTWGTSYMEHAPEQFSDNGTDYMEIQTGPMETQAYWDIMEPGEGSSFGCHWIPYRDIGGIAWSDNQLIFNVHENQTWLYPAIDQTVSLSVNGTVEVCELSAGTPFKCQAAVKDGDTIAISRDTELLREFTYPLDGEHEPDLEKRLEKEYDFSPRKDPETVEEWEERVKGQLKGAIFRKAIDSWQEILKLEPDNAAAHLGLADTLWHLGRFDEADEHISKALGTDQDTEAKAMQIRKGRAESFFWRGLQGIPEGFCRELKRAEILAGSSAFEEAYELYTKLLNDQPDNWQIHYALAQYWLRPGNDKAKAAEHALKAIELNPSYRDLYLELIPLLGICGKYAEIIETLKTVPAETAAISFLRKHLAYACFETGDYEGAWKILSQDKMFIWEGEQKTTDTQRDTACHLTLEALQNNDLETAKKISSQMEPIPANLDHGYRHFDRTRPALMAALIALAENKQDEAEAICRKALELQIEEVEAFKLHTSIDFWAVYTSHEMMYALGACARLIDDQELIDKTLAYFEPYTKTRKRFKGWRPVLQNLTDGLKAELEGDFETAAAAFKKHLAEEHQGLETARQHLQAVENNKRFFLDM